VESKTNRRHGENHRNKEISESKAPVVKKKPSQFSKFDRWLNLNIKALKSRCVELNRSCQSLEKKVKR